jgi:sialate O-acetylesterase
MLRWHQTFDVGYVPNNVVPKVFMAVALDLPDAANG